MCTRILIELCGFYFLVIVEILATIILVELYQKIYLSHYKICMYYPYP
jgi:hypothetical protein